MHPQINLLLISFFFLPCTFLIIFLPCTYRDNSLVKLKACSHFSASISIPKHASLSLTQVRFLFGAHLAIAIGVVESRQQCFLNAWRKLLLITQRSLQTWLTLWIFLPPSETSWVNLRFLVWDVSCAFGPTSKPIISRFLLKKPFFLYFCYIQVQFFTVENLDFPVLLQFYGIHIKVIVMTDWYEFNFLMKEVEGKMYL